MNRQLKNLVSVMALLLVRPVTTVACLPPDCDDCYYWDGYSCQPEGDCQHLYDCSGCQRCVNCYCEDQDYYCRYWHDPCWYCSNGECVNACTAGQVCIAGQCVTVSISFVAVSKANPTICEDVTFTVTTNPAGYEQNVTWTAPGGEPSGGGPSITFTTHWPCIGSKTVTAHLGASSYDKGVTVILPSGCREGSGSVNLTTSYDLVCPESWCQANPTGTGCTGPDPSVSPNPSGSIDAVYSGCAWEWQVNITFYRTYGICPGNVPSICSINDVPPSERTQEHITELILDLLDGGSPEAFCSDCTWEHEQVHRAAFDSTIAAGASGLESSGSVDPVPVNCGDPATTSCQALEASAYYTAISNEIEAIYQAARNAQTNAEDNATAVGNQCNAEHAANLCYYAADQGWNIPECE